MEVARSSSSAASGSTVCFSRCGSGKFFSMQMFGPFSSPRFLPMYGGSGGCDAATCRPIPGFQCREAWTGNYTTYPNNTPIVSVATRTTSGDEAADWTSVCTEGCYDGFVNAWEECDDANMDDNDGCTDCSIDKGWQCRTVQDPDDFANNLGSVCWAQCGDAIRIPGREECDDGNLQVNDGCDDTCFTEWGFACAAHAENGLSVGDKCSPICGDFLRKPGEGCDDGNLIAGDGCSALCQVEEGMACFERPYPSGDACVSTCGDGVLAPSVEQCDDGNLIAADGCGSTCRIEPGYSCYLDSATQRSVCEPVCGDAEIIFPETCDDGNVIRGDGCSDFCAEELGWVCNRITLECKPLCGDGIRVIVEACDDGNLEIGDGCDSSCQLEPYFLCMSYVEAINSTKSVCEPVCGDGVVVGGETCEDGNNKDKDGCSSVCQVEYSYFVDMFVMGMGSRVLLEGEDHEAVGEEDQHSSSGSWLGAVGDSVWNLLGAGSWEKNAVGVSDLPPDVRNLLPEHVLENPRFILNSKAAQELTRRLRHRREEATETPSNYLLGGASASTEQGEAGTRPAEGIDGAPDASFEHERGAAAPDASFEHERGAALVEFAEYVRQSRNSPLAISGLEHLKAEHEEQLRISFARRNLPELLQVDADDQDFEEGDASPARDVRIADQGRRSQKNDHGSLEEAILAEGRALMSTPSSSSSRNLGASVEFAAARENYPSPKKTGVAPVMEQEDSRYASEEDVVVALASEGYNGVSEEDDSSADRRFLQIPGFPGWHCCYPFPERSFTCSNATYPNNPCEPARLCGNSFLDPGEGCDDGNSVDGDGCSRFCTIELGFRCHNAGFFETGMPSFCQAVCGDLVQAGAEECDDGNLFSGDGCSGNCRSEDGWTCRRASGRTLCEPVCGDGKRMGYEECDDGNQ